MNSSNLTNSTCGPVDTSAHAFFMVVHSLVFVVGLILNGFTLKVYFCWPPQHMSSSVTVYLKNLAFCDFFISLCLPLRIINYSNNNNNRAYIRQIYCNFGASAFYLNMYASILFMGYIAANRYLKIVHPLGTHILQTVRASHIISVVTWSFLVSMMFTYVLVSLVTQEPYTNITATVDCDVLHSAQVRLLYKVLHCCTASIFLLVLVSLVFFYYSTSRRLALAQQRQPASSGSTQLARSRRKMLVLVIVFCVCFVPYHLVRLPYAFRKKECTSQVFFYLKELTIMVSVLNVCLDPLIYFIFCKSFRSQLGMRNTRRAANGSRRGSDGRMTSLRVNRKLSLSTTVTKQTSVL